MNVHLRDELVSILRESAPARTEVLLITGEQFDEAALELAKTYMRADDAQRSALVALARVIDRAAQ